MTTSKKINYKRIKELSDQDLFKVEKTYTNSFPEEERRAFPLFLELLEKEPRFKVYALFNEQKYIGFITTWQFNKFTYIEHFAIDESARNGGFGNVVMKQFIEKLANPIILEVELPKDEMSIRRVGFYERLGFTLDSHDYLQPPYRLNAEWVPMRIMSCGDINLPLHFEEIKNALYKYVYNQ